MGGQGFHTIQEPALNILIDLILEYLDKICSAIHNTYEHAGRTEANLHDISAALTYIGINEDSFTYYVKYVYKVMDKTKILPESVESFKNKQKTRLRTHLK